MKVSSMRKPTSKRRTPKIRTRVRGQDLRQDRRQIRGQGHPYRYLLLWKPYGVLSQFSPGVIADQKNLKDFVDVPNVYPVGRLDRESEGLLLLTDHGAVQHRICDPRFGHSKTYWVQVERTPTPEAIKALEDGVVIKGGYRTRRAQVRLLSDPPQLPPRIPPIRTRKSIETAWLSLTITEGKNRQVRRMTAAVGFPTLRLVRTSIHISGKDQCLDFTLDRLTPGHWRDVTETEERCLLGCLTQ